MPDKKVKETQALQIELYGLRKPRETKEAFIKRYCGAEPRGRILKTRRVVRCHCDSKSCTGWAMLPRKRIESIEEIC